MLAADPAAGRCTSSTTTSCPTPARGRSARAGTPNAGTPSPAGTTRCCVDARGRAVVFGTGEPTGLATTLPGVLAQLRPVIGPDAPILLGFDRGGAYPAVFTACRDAGADWVTYRRAPLAAPTGRRGAPRPVRRPATGSHRDAGRRDGRTQRVRHGPAADPVRARRAGAAGPDQRHHRARRDLLCWLRARWRIENMFKYAAEHNGIDALADYMDIGPDTRPVANPAREAANDTVKTRRPTWSPPNARCRSCRATAPPAWPR